MEYILVGLAGIIGASLRYLVSFYLNEWSFHDFPLATFLTNIIGCFLLGWLTTFLPRLKSLPPYVITALGTGLIGSFTTFSTFSVETVELIQASKWDIAAFYVLTSLWGGLTFSWIGYKLGIRKSLIAKEM